MDNNKAGRVRGEEGKRKTKKREREGTEDGSSKKVNIVMPHEEVLL